MNNDNVADSTVGSFVVPADHPTLPGHFPGNPVVPGVLILDYVLQMLGFAPDRPREIPWVKFMQPLLPDQCAVVAARRNESRVRFSVSHDGRKLVSGLIVDVPTTSARESSGEPT